MLQLSSIYYNRPVLSLRSGGVIGQAFSPLINPDNLRIEGWYAKESGQKGTNIIPISEVRDIISKGIVVDDHSSITKAEDLVRLQKIIDLRFELIGQNVFTERKKKIGRVQDYATDTDTNMIQKLYLNQNFLKALTSQQLIIDRQQIIEINNKGIVVRENTERVRAGESATVPA